MQTYHVQSFNQTPGGYWETFFHGWAEVKESRYPTWEDVDLRAKCFTRAGAEQEAIRLQLLYPVENYRVTPCERPGEPHNA